MRHDGGNALTLKTIVKAQSVTTKSDGMWFFSGKKPHSMFATIFGIGGAAPGIESASTSLKWPIP